MRAPDRRVLLAVAALLATTAPVSARSARWARPLRHERLIPGQTLEVGWPEGSVPENAEEMELILSLDGGRTFPVRVTGEISPDAARFEWTVPSIPTDRARLALRVGDEDGESEAIRAVSDEFTIAPDSARPPEDLLALRGEWRTRDALELPSGDGVPASSLAGGSAIRSAIREEPEGTLPRSGAVRVCSYASRPTPAPPPDRPTPIAPTLPPPSSAPTPLRL